MEATALALYKYAADIAASSSDAFDKIHSPGTPAPHSGIYRCKGCNREVASNGGEPLPPQNHHQHTTTQGSIRWRMVVYADHKPS